MADHIDDIFYKHHPTGDPYEENETVQREAAKQDPFTTGSTVRNANWARPEGKRDNRSRPEIERDRWGRYVLTDPVSGKKKSFQRTTTFAKMASDTFALGQWQQRMTLLGASQRPDLVSLAYTLDVSRDKKQLDDMVEQAKDQAGQKKAANLGTALHAMTEEIDAGVLNVADAPPAHHEDLAAYERTMRDAGITLIPELIERVTAVPSLLVAGTFDRIVRCPDGKLRVADLKTGRDLSFGWGEIAVQLAVYASGVNEVGVWTDQGWCGLQDSLLVGWDRLDTEVADDYAIVMHLPVGKGQCTLYKVDLEAGRAGMDLCDRVRTWRKAKGMAEVWEPVSDLYPVPKRVIGQGSNWDWFRLFEKVRTKGEARALWLKVKDQVTSEELDLCTKLGKEALARA